MNQVRDMARAIPAKHVFFAIDACFSGLMAARETPKPYRAETVSRLTRGRLRQVLTAGDRDQRAWEEAGHGLFTRRLLEGLDGEADVSPRDGVLTAMELAAYVQGQVTEITQGKQTPVFAKMEGVGQFVFTAPGIGRGAVARERENLAGMRAKLEAERRNLEAEETRLERERLEAERKSLEAKRRRIEEAKKRLAALKKNVGAGRGSVDSRTRPRPSSRPPKPPRVAVAPGTPQRIGSGLDAMVRVPAGRFTMGSSDEDLRAIPESSRKYYLNERPKRRVYLDAFYIDKYPVTNVRFRKFGEPKKDYGSKFNGDRWPVVGVTWSQARDYCRSVGKRLPTEAEWEKAARGVDGRRYPWGNQWDGSKVIWSKNSGQKTHPVDRTYNTHRSPYGAVDLVGNTYEWVSDWYGKDYYASAPTRNPKGPASGIRRVLRGGSWLNVLTWYYRAALRAWYDPGNRSSWLSFRCAKASNK